MCIVSEIQRNIGGKLPFFLSGALICSVPTAMSKTLIPNVFCLVHLIHHLSEHHSSFPKFSDSKNHSIHSSNLLRSRYMTSSSQQPLPLSPVFSCSVECHILSFHQVAQQVHSFPTSCNLLSNSSLNYSMQQ